MIFDTCWDCQYERTCDEVLFKDKQIRPEILEKEIPKSLFILNIIGLLAFIVFSRYIFTILAHENFIVLTINILFIAIALIGFYGIISMKKLGLYLFTSFCILGYLALFFVDEPLVLFVALIIPTIIIIWVFANYQK